MIAGANWIDIEFGQKDMLSYKTIFRLDFSFAYALLDHLGQYIEFLDRATRLDPFTGQQNRLDVLQRQFMCEGDARSTHYVMTLTLNSIDAVLETGEGIRPFDIADHPVVRLADSLTKEIPSQQNQSYTRIGLRQWIVADRPALEFSKIRDQFLTQAPKISGALKKGFAPVEDIALTLESKNASDESIRLTCGPYQSNEAKKHFPRLQPEIKQGIIFDLDMWQNNIRVEAFSLSSNIRHFSDQSAKIVTSLVDVLGED